MIFSIATFLNMMHLLLEHKYHVNYTYFIMGTTTHFYINNENLFDAICLYTLVFLTGWGIFIGAKTRIYTVYRSVYKQIEAKRFSVLI